MMPTPFRLPASMYLLLFRAECLFGAAYACIKKVYVAALENEER
jgi:hypothetical protein